MFSKTDEFFLLGNADKLSLKQLAINAEFTDYKNGKPVQNILENEVNDSEPHILTTLETENNPTDDLLLASTPEIEKLKSVHIRSYSGPYFPAFGLNTEIYGVFLHIQSECGKIRSRITANTDTFYAVTKMDREVHSNSTTRKI